MKTIKITLVAFVLAILIVGLYADAAMAWTDKQTKAHEIAEIARSMGLPEDNPIITEAKRIWEEENQTAKYTDDELLIIATVIYNEAGNGCTEEHQLLVGRVLLNRVADGRFGGKTVYDCVVAPAQYLKGYANGDSRYAIPADRYDEMIALARRVTAGEPLDCPTNVLYQNNQRHGTGEYKSFYSSVLGSTTYFCYG